MSASRLSSVLGIVCLSALVSSGQYKPGGLASGPPDPAAQPTGVPAEARLDPGRLPLCFTPLEGDAGYVVRGRDKSVYFAPEGLALVLPFEGEEARRAGQAAVSAGSRGGRWIVKLDFLDAASGIAPRPGDKRDTTYSYFRGEPEEWRTGVPAYGQIVYPALWPGIDLAFSGTFDRLKYEFVVRAGADPSRIRLAYRGVEGLAVSREGCLEVSTPAGGFADDTPIAWQERGGRRVPVSVSYKLGPAGRRHEFGFEIGAYDMSLPLVLDPAVFIHAGYFGGGGTEIGYAVALDAAGYIYLTGDTTSAETIGFPAAVGPDLNYNGGDDAFVAKLKPGGAGIVYCGYIGGGADDWGNGIAVDGAGNAYVAGETMSSQAAGFPVTAGPDLEYGGGSKDAFVARVRADGTALDYCGYIGGAAEDFGLAVAADHAGNAYVTGNTYSTQLTGFPVLDGPDMSANGSGDAFVCKVSPGGAFVYSGFIGGNGDDFGRGVAVDGSGSAYVTGRTGSGEASFPDIVGPDTSYNGNNDAFLAKVNSAGTGLVYCGYIGGAAGDDGKAIAVDAAGNAYVAGSTTSTQSTSFPVLVGPDLTANGNSDAFVAKVNAAGTALVYCGFLGGSGSDEAFGLALDAAGRAHLCGYTNSSQATFPVKAGPDLTYASGVYDGFAARVNAPGSALDYCGYIGGTDLDIARGIAVDPSGNAWVTGHTTSSFSEGFPVTGYIINDLQGLQDAFLAGINFTDERVSKHAAGDVDGDGQDEALIDFGPNGAWLYDGVVWSQLTTVDPEGLTACDIDGDGAAEIIADLGPLGLWLWNAGAWNLLSGLDADGVAAGDVDGDLTAEVVGDFAANGLWLLNGGGWTQLSAVNADFAVVRDVDGVSAEVGCDFGASGLWLWCAGVWSHLSGENADYCLFGDTDWAGGRIVCDFGTKGLWVHDGGWIQLSGVNADAVLAADLDGDTLDEVVANFPGGWGLWEAKGGAWTNLSRPAAVVMIAANLDADPPAELAAGFGGIGLFLYDVGEWTALAPLAPESLLAADLDGNGRQEIIADFGRLGLWLWDGGSWNQVSAFYPD